MSHETSLHLLFVASLSATLAAGMLAWSHRSLRTARTFLLVVLGDGIWTLGYVVELVSRELEAKLWWDGIQYAGAIIAAGAVVAFAREYVGQRVRRLGLYYALAYSLPLGLIVYLLTPSGRAQLRATASLADLSRYWILSYPFTWLDYALVSYLCAASLYSLVLLAKCFVPQSAAHRRQTAVIFLGLALPSTNILTVALDLRLLGQRDFAPLLFGLGNLLIVWALSRWRLFDLVPVARDLVFDEIPDGVLVLDEQGRIVDANKSALHLSCKPEGELLGKKLVEAFEQHHQALAMLEPRNHKRVEMTCRVEQTDRAIAFEISDLGARQEGARGSLVLLRDMTATKLFERAIQHNSDELERRVSERTRELSLVLDELRNQIKERTLAEKALKESETQLRTLIEASTDSILVIRGRKIVDCNRRTLELFGYSREEIVGRTLLGISPGQQADGSDSEAELDRRFAQALGGSPQQFEWRYGSKHGEALDTEQSLTRINIGPEEHFQAVIRDVTERKKAEAERQSLQAQLNHAQKMDSIGRLAGAVAHDFNNLLTAIMGGASLALLDVPEEHPVAAALREIEATGQSAVALTRQLLAFSRKQIIEPKTLDLNDVIRHVHKLLSRLITENVILETSLQTDLEYVKVDQGQIEQILVNLAVNARDAMPEGGRLRIETWNVQLDEDYARRHEGVHPGNWVALMVGDTGHGMSRETLDRVFEPFFTTKAAGKGTGLGLATVYGAVKQNGGIIEVESHIGIGTTFQIMFPSSSFESNRETNLLDAQALPNGNETIWLVEDQDVVRDFAGRLLRRLGYTVHVFADGSDAVRAAASYGGAIDLLITDVVMPGLSGKAVAEELLKNNPDVPVLFMSGYPDRDIDLGEHKTELLAKPFTPTTLAQKVREMLKRPGHLAAQR